MNWLSKIKITRNLLIALGALAVLVEVSWAIWTVMEPVEGNDSQAAVKKTEKTTLSLSVSKNSWRVGENIPLVINISSSKLTDGADVIVRYDPKMLAVSLDENTTIPVKVGGIYTDYPYNQVDATIGRLTVSGITSRTGGVVPNGILGTVILQAKTPGQTKISFEFAPDRTTDSNVIETKTAKDVLEEAKSLDLTIVP